ncbi:hypothetical protein FB45DRAFT_875427 [Roridomyces roridus]|uniref:Uncharacterized protein n=1 Tax=Roridomyces roridus TaxID=1738132 RepID=A0AAD7B658_9AGAR|nr:hypothetical protein FB45DRAFT_875427 [Roridomyces roridus]
MRKIFTAFSSAGHRASKHETMADVFYEEYREYDHHYNYDPPYYDSPQYNYPQYNYRAPTRPLTATAVALTAVMGGLATWCATPGASSDDGSSAWVVSRGPVTTRHGPSTAGNGYPVSQGTGPGPGRQNCGFRGLYGRAGTRRDGSLTRHFDGRVGALYDYDPSYNHGDMSLYEPGQDDAEAYPFHQSTVVFNYLPFNNAVSQVQNLGSYRQPPYVPSGWLLVSVFRGAAAIADDDAADAERKVEKLH